MVISKITLGTAQFGMDYGINNQRGKIPKEEIFQILNTCVDKGILFFDTAHSYGNSESILGEFIKTTKSDVNIFSKLPVCNYDDVESIVNESLRNLQIDTIDGYYVHSFESYVEDPKLWDSLLKLKKDGKIRKIGFSLYYPEELEILLDNNVPFDIVQTPYNIFDQRFAKYFSLLKSKGIEVFVRSVFLQGLLFKSPSKLSSSFLKVKDKISDIQRIPSENDIPLAALLMNFAIINENIDHVVVGIDNISNLKELISSLDFSEKVQYFEKEFLDFRVDDEDIILPFNWG